MSSGVKWIKLYTDIFSNRKINQIEQRENGDAYIVIWFKLLVLAGNVNESGMIVLTKDIPYTDEMLANEFHKPKDVIQKALALFEQFNMIEIVDNIMMVSNWEKYQNEDSLENLRAKSRERSQRYRDRQKERAAEKLGMTVTQESRDASRHVTQQEERIEDIRDKNNIEEVEAQPKEPPVFQIELNDGTLYDVVQSEIDYYQKLYPAVNVMNEMRAIVGWNHGNPKKRKTRSGIKRHINTWLSDKQNNGGSSRRSNNGYVPIPAAIPDVDDGSNPFAR